MHTIPIRAKLKDTITDSTRTELDNYFSAHSFIPGVWYEIVDDVLIAHVTRKQMTYLSTREYVEELVKDIPKRKAEPARQHLYSHYSLP